MGASKERAAPGGLRHSRGTYFTSLQLQNVRCFGAMQSLALTGSDGSPARWTIVLGENGVGKTTLLQLLALSSGGVRLDPYMYEFLEFDGGPGPPVEFFRNRDVAGTVQAELISGGERVTVEFSVGEEASPAPQPSEPRPVVCGYGAGRRLGASRLSRHRPRSSRLKHASLFVDAPLRNAEEWLLGEDYAASKERRAGGPAQRRLERLTELLTRLLPEVNDVRVGEPRKRWEPSVEFKTPYGWVPLYGLSLGYQSLVAWMVDLAATMFDQYEKREDPLAEPAIVLVDEIDLHLHPKWQRDLMAFLTERFPNTQFIATAHSPLVVQAAEDANVVLLRREGDQVIIDNNPADVRNWRIDQILTSDLYGLPTARPPRLDKLVAERRKILTKGKLTPSLRKRLHTIEQQIGDLPAGESPDQQRALALILDASRDLDRHKTAKKP